VTLSPHRRVPLVLNGALVMQMVEHALRDHPVEACGMLVGPKGAKPVECWPMANVHPERLTYARFAFDPDDQLQAWAKLDQLGWDPLVIYHSHTGSAAVPSRYDHAHSFEPGAVYVIISTRDEEPVIRAWRRVGAGLVEVGIAVSD
jgi:proteasome lid subunit RPN8/RPN11